MIETPAYDFLSPPRIVFGWGRRVEIGKLATSLGRRAFIVQGSRTLDSSGMMAELTRELHAAGIEAIQVAAISHEPEIGDVDRAAETVRDQKVGLMDLVLAIGGGSAIDLGKAVSAMVTQPVTASVRDYLEGVGTGRQLVEAPLPLLAMPTTGGTGSEATKNAVISVTDPPCKKSLRCDQMVPRIVLVDPELSVSVPPTTTAWTGMDAITQLIESYISRRARPIPQALAVDGLRRALPALSEAFRNGATRWARENMAQAALLSGMALANSGLGMAHGVAAALGVECQVPHGLACAVMLPAALEANRACCERPMADLARAVLDGDWSSDAEAAGAFIERIEQLCDEVDVPRRLSRLGVRPDQVPALVLNSRGNSMDGNPRDISNRELQVILEQML